MMTKIAGALAALTALFILACLGKVVENNDAHTYHVWQGLGGRLAVIDQPGMYFQNFGKYWEYPRTVQIKFLHTGDEDGDQSIRATFNDGGSARISTVITLGLPADESRRIELHRTFGGNLKNLELAVLAHLTNAIKNSGPLMTATENQTGRKAEFNQIIEDQLRAGLYEMRRQEKVLEGQVDSSGQPVRVVATSIITDEKGKSVIHTPSPLTQYGLTVMQFSITETEYDEMSRKQFATKQEAFLKAESSKAQRDGEIQQKLLAEAKGEREAAEARATANLEKVKAETAAAQKVAVAAQAKLEAETVAAQKLAVAMKEKKAAETRARQEAEVARIGAENELKMAEFRLQAAEKDAKSKIVLADAAAREIEVGGKVKQSEQVLAEIKAKRDVEVAQALSQIRVPSTIIGGGSGGSAPDLTGQMISYQLLRASGLLAPEPPRAANPKD